MKENLGPGPELTGRRVSSTLNEAHSSPNAGSTMPEPGQPDQPRPSLPEGTAPQRSSVAQEVADIIQRRMSEGSTQEQEEARHILETLSQGGQEGRREGRREQHRSRFQQEIADPQLKVIVGRLDASPRVESEDLVEAVDEIRNLINADPTNTALRAEGEGLIRQFSTLSAKGERIGFYLQDDDREQLMIDPQSWLDKKFDLVYLAAQSGQELNSQILQGVQSLVGEANQFLSRRFQKAFDEGNIADREKYRAFVETFNKTFATRLNLLITRVQVDKRGMEQVVGSYEQLRVQGLLGALSFDNSRVGAMFNRMNEFLEDVRLAEGGKEFHLTPQMVTSLQSRIEKEQFDFALAGTGVFADEYKKAQLSRTTDAEDVLKAEIRRAVRTAYDVFVSSQRLAIISSRGHHLSGVDAIFSDAGGAFNIFNLEDLLIGKFSLLNEHQNEFLNRIKLDLAEHESKAQGLENLSRQEKLDLGTRLFRDLFAVPDFFSSGWRIKGILQQIENVTRYKLQNAEIVKSLLRGGAGEIHTQFEEYLATQQNTSGWRDLVSISGEQKAKEITAFNFAKGIAITEGTRITEGLSFEQRTAYILSSGMNNADFNRKVKSAARDLGLFLQLKNPEVAHDIFGDTTKSKEGQDKEKESWRKDTWEKIRKYRPEEILRLVRERSNTDSGYDAAMRKKLNSIFSSSGIGTAENGYDTFKLQYGAAMQSLRESGLQDSVSHQVDMKHLSSDQEEILNKALNASLRTRGVNYAQKVKGIYEKIDSFIAEGDILGQLIRSPKYEDIYARTITVDDAILNDLEYVPENSGMPRLSDFWTNEIGADALKRNGNDLMNAVAAGQALVGFLKAEGREEYLKHAEEFAKKAGEYNGVKNGIVKCFRYTYGSYLLTSEQDYFADLTGLGKLPFRLASSDMERIFGPGVSPMTREFLLKELDKVRSYLTGEPGTDPEKYYNQMVALLGIDAMSRLRDRSLTIFMYLSLLLLLVPAAASVEVVGAATR